MCTCRCANPSSAGGHGGRPALSRSVWVDTAVCAQADGGGAGPGRSGEGHQPTSASPPAPDTDTGRPTDPADRSLGRRAASCQASRLSAITACITAALRSFARPGRGRPSARRSRPRARGRGPAWPGDLLVALDGGGERDPAGQQVGQVVVDLVDLAAQVGQRVLARPDHPDVGRVLLVAAAVGGLELDQAVPAVEAAGAGVGLEDPQREARPGAAPWPGRAGPRRRPCAGRSGATYSECSQSPSRSEEAEHVRRPRPRRPRPRRRGSSAVDPGADLLGRGAPTAASAARGSRSTSTSAHGRQRPAGVAGLGSRRRPLAGRQSSSRIDVQGVLPGRPGRPTRTRRTPPSRVLEPEAYGVQPLPVQAEPPGERPGRRRRAGRRRRGASAPACAPGSGGCARSRGGPRAGWRSGAPRGSS